MTTFNDFMEAAIIILTIPLTLVLTYRPSSQASGSVYITGF